MSLSTTLSLEWQVYQSKTGKKIKTVPENFKYLRLSKTLNDVEGYTFIVFHMVSWPRLFWRKWEQTSINILSGSQFWEEHKRYKMNLNVKAISSGITPTIWEHCYAGYWWWCRASYDLILIKWQSLQRLGDALQPLFYIWGKWAAEIFYICQRT